MIFSRPDKIFARRNVNIAGIECTVERKNIRRLNIYVKPPDGRVLVTAPFLYTEREIQSFVASKADWIRKHQGQIRRRSLQARMALKYESGEVLYFWGRPYDLTVAEEPGRKRGKIILAPGPVFRPPDENRCELEVQSASGHGSAVLVVPEASTREQREQLVKNEYKKLLEKEAERVLDLWSEKTGLQYSGWHSRYMKSRWGSLSVRNKRVCLNTRLAEKPEICLIYVALHEIAHVKEANHGPRFKAILDEYMPDWRKAEKLLKYSSR